MPNPVREWSAFILISLFWGTSFLWIKIALRELDPIWLVAYRLSLGTVALFALAVFRREPFFQLKSHWKKLFFLSLINSYLPFFLITWGETRIDSGMASILNGTVPLFAIVLAHPFLPEERMTVRRVLGLVCGFAGVVALFGGGASQPDHGGLFAFWGQLAVVVAAISYAVASIYARAELRDFPPLLLAAGTVGCSAVLTWIHALVSSRGLVVPQLGLTWFAVAWLGLFGTCLAYSLYYFVVRQWGATRATLVNYAYPALGLLLGAAFLGERLTWYCVGGLALVVLGIVVAKSKPKSF